MFLTKYAAETLLNEAQALASNCFSDSNNKIVRIEVQIFMSCRVRMLRVKLVCGLIISGALWGLPGSPVAAGTPSSALAECCDSVCCALLDPSTYSFTNTGRHLFNINVVLYL